MKVRLGLFILILSILLSGAGILVGFYHFHHAKPVKPTIADDGFASYRLPEYPAPPPLPENRYDQPVSTTEFQIPPDQALSRENAINTAKFQWFRYYLASYAHRSGVLNKDGMKEYLDDMVRLWLYPCAVDPDRFQKQAESLRRNGTDHLLIDAGLALAEIHRNRLEDYEHVTRKIQNIIGRMRRDPHCPAMVMFFLGSNLAGGNITRSLVVQNEKFASADQTLAQAFRNGEIRPQDLQLVYRLMEDSGINMLFSKTLPKLAKQSELPEYFLDLLRGAAEIDLAWQQYGAKIGIVANSSRHRSFLDHMKQAGKYLEKSYLARPDLPEAAAAMITVAMAGSEPPGSNTISCFNRAVRAQNDYMTAYRNMLWSLGPRQEGTFASYQNIQALSGVIQRLSERCRPGYRYLFKVEIWKNNYADHDRSDSFKALLTLGDAALSSHLYNTDVPLFYLRVLESVINQTPSLYSRLIWREKIVQENLARMFSAYNGVALSPSCRLNIMARQTACLTYTGAYKQAAALWQQLPDYVKKYEFNPYDTKALIVRPDSGYLNAEINLGLEDAKSQFEQIDESCAMNNSDAATTALLPLLKKYAGQKDAMEWLRKRLAEVNSTTWLCRLYMEKDPLAAAIRLGDEKTVKLLVDNGADVNRVNFEGWNSLHQAAYMAASPQIAEILLQAGADLDKQDEPHHNSPLLAAMAFQRDEMIKIMIKYCKNINQRANAGFTPLDFAIQYNTPEIVEMLIAKGADLNLCDGDGWSPVYRAVYLNRLDMAEVLLKQNAKVNIRDNQNKTALDIARCSEMRDLLKRYHAEPGQKL